MGVFYFLIFLICADDDDDDIHVNPDGDDNESCGRLSSPCKTIYYAFVYNNTNSTTPTLSLAAGIYTETSSLQILEDINIVGTSRIGCVVSKSANSKFILFNLNSSDVAFTLQTLTVDLTNHSDTDNMVKVTSSRSLSLLDCDVRNLGGTSIYGYSFYVVSPSVILSFVNCSVVNTLSSCDSALFCFYNYSSLTITDCHFSNFNISSTTAASGVFHIPNDMTNINLTLSTFSSCSTDGYGSVFSYSQSENMLSGSHVVFDRCVFSNCSAYSCGVVRFFSSASALGSFRAENCSFLDIYSKDTDYFGGVFGFSSYVQVDFNCSLFSNCSHGNNSLGFGGALYCSTVNSSIASCVFVMCSAFTFGGAVLYDNIGNHRLSNCRFSGNTASYGSDVYANSTAQAFTISNVTDSCTTGNYRTFYQGIYKVVLGLCDSSCSSASASLLETPPVCLMPCLHDGMVNCVNVSSCPEDFLPLAGRCVSWCGYLSTMGDDSAVSCNPCEDVSAGICNATAGCIWNGSCESTSELCGVESCAACSSSTCLMTEGCMWEEGYCQAEPVPEEEQEPGTEPESACSCVPFHRLFLFSILFFFLIFNIELS